MDAGGGLAEVAARGPARAAGTDARAAGTDARAVGTDARAAGTDARDAAGDLEARFENFVTSHRERARRLAWRLVGGDVGAAEDVAQDAFLRAWRSLGRFREEASLSTWFYRILVRQAANHRRWRGVRERLGGWGNPDAAADAPPPGDPALRDRIGHAVGSLTRRQREVFVLVHLEGFTVRETAGLLGRPEGTVKSHLHRALARLRRELSDLREPDGRPADARDVEPAPAGAPGAAPRAHEEPEP